MEVAHDPPAEREETGPHTHTRAHTHSPCLTFVFLSLSQVALPELDIFQRLLVQAVATDPESDIEAFVARHPRPKNAKTIAGTCVC